LAAVGFHDDSRLEIHEIRNVRTHRPLTAKLALLEATGAQVTPQTSFRIGHLPP